MPNSVLMHSSLWLLIRLSLRARGRRLRRLLGTWKGRFVLLGVVGMFCMWLFGTMVGSSGPMQPETIRNSGAMVLASMLLMNVLLGSSEGVAFRPAEVEFLFPAPIPRRQLLLFRIVSIGLVTLPSAFFLSIAFHRRVPMFLALFAGAWLSFMCLALSVIVWQLLGSILGQAMAARGRKGVLFLLVGIVIAAIATGAMQLELSLTTATDFAASSLGQKVLSPFRPFSSVLASTTYPELGRWAGVSFAIIVGLSLLILRLDLNHTEASLAASQRIAKRMTDARSGRLAFNQGNSFLKRFSVPKLPRLFGAGPIAWHQLTALLRSAGSLTMFVVIIGGAISAPMLMSQSVEAKQLVVTMAMMTVFLLPQFIQYDFRSELDRMTVLKALPLNPIAICFGELMAPLLATLIVQVIMLCLVLTVGGADSKLTLTIAAFVLPVDFLVYAVENFVFLLFPFRMGPGQEQGLQNMVRVMGTMVLKFLLIGLFAGTAGGLGGLCYYLTKNEVPAIGVAWIITVISCTTLLPALAWAFRRFDPASDTPD